MSIFTAIDLSNIPAPKVVEVLDYEVILSEMLDDLRDRDPSFTAVVESDPAYKILEVAAYRELLLRQRVNDAARAVMLAYATGSDLDNLSAYFGVQRLLLDPGDPDAIPPVLPTYESDADLRRRTQLALEALTTAGSEGSYLFHALSAHAQVKDAGVDSPEPGEVVVTVLSRIGNGVPTSDILQAVNERLSGKYVRPFTDQVTVQAASSLAYSITGTLYLYPGPDAELIRETAVERLSEYVESMHRIGQRVSLSGIYSALHIEGVERVTLTAPVADIIPTATQAPYCTGISIQWQRVES